MLVPGKKSFKILNAATEHLDIPLYLTVESSAQPNNQTITKIVCRGESEDPADPHICQWSIKQVKNSDAIR